MKEKDIVNFDNMDKSGDDYLDDDGRVVGCEICYIHEKANEKFANIMQSINIEGRVSRIREPLTIQLCPKCNEALYPHTDYGYHCGVVSETNYSVPNGEIGFYEFMHCENCEQDYAMMPIPISWNANHDILYTGGRDYAEDSDIKELVDDVFEKIKPSIEQFVERKLNPENFIDENLQMWQINTWCKSDVEHAICNWLYDKGYKK